MGLALILDLASGARRAEAGFSHQTPHFQGNSISDELVGAPPFAVKPSAVLSEKCNQASLWLQGLARWRESMSCVLLARVAAAQPR
jgi:hypothetical protein